MGKSKPNQTLICKPRAGESTPARTRLGTHTDIKREIANLYRQMKTGQIESQAGTRLAYVLNLLNNLIKDTDLLKRVEALENHELRKKS